VITSNSFELAKKDNLNPSSSYIYELKYDGTRNFAIIENHRITKLLNRNSIDNLDLYPHLKDINIPFKNAILDAELCVFDEMGKSNLNLVRTQKYFKDAVLIAFDILEVDGRDLRREALLVRRELLEKALSTFSNPSLKISKIYPNFQTAKADVKSKNLEGFMAKVSNSHYIGGRSSRWLKFVFRKEVVATFKHYEETKAGITLFNDLIRVACNGQQFKAVKHKLDTEGSIDVEVAYLEQTDSGRYRQPTFKRMVIA